MAVEKALLELLVCPDSKEKLSEASTALVERLNEAIRAGTLKTRGGQVVTDEVDGALVRADGKLAYLVRDEIPNMLVDEAVPLEPLDPPG